MTSKVVIQLTDETQRIEAALRKLPISEAHEPAWRDMIISGLAREFSLMSRNDATPNSQRPACASTTRRELADLKVQAERTLEALESLHLPAATALSNMFVPAWRSNLRTSLRLLAAWCGHVEVEETAPTVGRGSPPKMRAATVSRLVRQYYPLLVGSEATITTGTDDGIARGAFIDVLKELFDILGIDASAESQARAALRPARNAP